MHNAPPVIYPVGRFVWGIPCIAVLALTGAVGLLCWQATSGAEGLTVWGAWAVWAVSSTLALSLEARESSAQGHLGWCGDGWSWRDGHMQERVVRLSLLLDGGRYMWVSYRMADAFETHNAWPRIAIVRQTDMPLAWHGFRCAVYSRPLGNGMTSDQPQWPMII
jgi:hypothetical protein